MQKLFKKFVALFAGAMLLETPAPAPVHLTPAPTQAPPAVVEAASDPVTFSQLRFKLDSKFLHIWFPSILNADEAILVYGDEVFMIDCGDKRASLAGAKLLNKLGITRIDKLFNSHPHPDHLRGLPFTDEAAAVQQLLVCFPRDATSAMIEIMEYADANNIPVSDYADGDTFSMGDGEITLQFWCNNNPDLDMNNNSAVTLVRYNQRSILFAADIEQSGMNALLQRVSGTDLKADIIKYPHHGHPFLTDDFMAAVFPSVAVVTNTSVDWTGIKYLRNLKIPIYFTCHNDTVLHLYTDGTTWVIERIPINKVQPIQN